MESGSKRERVQERERDRERPLQGLLAVQRFMNLRVDLFACKFSLLFFDCCFLPSVSALVVVLAQCQRLVWNDNQREVRATARMRHADRHTDRVRG